MYVNDFEEEKWMRVKDFKLSKQMEQAKKERGQKWIEEGNQLLKWRESLGVSRAFIAREAAVDCGRIKRLEQGEPIKEARLIVQVYKLILEKVEMNRALIRLLEGIGIKE